MLAVAVMVRDGSDERLVVVCPSGDMRITPRDAIIAFKRMTKPAENIEESIYKTEVQFSQVMPSSVASDASNLASQVLPDNSKSGAGSSPHLSEKSATRPKTSTSQNAEITHSQIPKV